MNNSFINKIKDLALIPEVHGHLPLLKQKTIYNYKYSLARSNFWVFLAKKSKNYKRFYSEIMHEVKSTNLIDVKGDNLDEMCIKINKYGVSYIPNFFPSGQYIEVIKELNNQKIKDLNRSHDGYYGNVKYWDHFLTNNDEYIHYLKDSITSIAKKLLFPISKNRIRINYSRLIKEDKIQDGDANTIFHSDRFIPTLKFFYYPNNSVIDSAPFEFIPFSHYISDSFLSAYKKYFLDVSKKLKSPYPCALDFTNNLKPLSLTVPGNSLVACYTHGMHRRRPFPEMKKSSSILERDILVIHFYNQQTKLTLFNFF